MVDSTTKIGVIAKKIGMTNLFQEDKLIACTIVKATPCVVTQIKTTDKDGYEAVQIATYEKKAKHTNKAMAGHFKKANVTPKKKIVEFRGTPATWGKNITPTLGSTIEVQDIFEEGEYIDVVGTAKAHGFTGVVKRHGFKGSKEHTHGQGDQARASGSIGACATPSRVFKGKRMAGRSGGQRVTVSNLKIIKIIKEQGIVIIGAPIPGNNKSIIILQK